MGPERTYDVERANILLKRAQRFEISLNEARELISYLEEELDRARALENARGAVRLKRLIRGLESYIHLGGRDWALA